MIRVKDYNKSLEIDALNCARFSSNVGCRLVATFETAWKKTDGPVMYYGGSVTVQLGDRVEVRSLFRRRRKGIVNYVPGVSQMHGEMEHNGLYWIGIKFSDESFVGIIVDPETGCIKKKVQFLERGSVESAIPLPPEPFE